ncbi:hypothetical protein CBR_g22995 [Chara braunii]|uniref:ABC transporter domain-containing protein n=1 Tax=Chara braunii TaxID=69332 RepID=A0A388L388_CHABU|nr:hypothetical protein CBR_g22995 [Chara braunii]|eukprot:GBG76779.1 hypothetical protein CBR_g22995 [Chara braunii]
MEGRNMMEIAGLRVLGAHRWRDWSQVLMGMDPNSCRKDILSDVNLALKAGTITAIMGPDGSGKSTLLAVLAGVGGSRMAGLSAYGEIQIDGLQRDRAYRRLVAYVPEEDDLYGELTVEECVMYSAMLRLPAFMPVDQKKRRVELMLEALGLDMVANSRVGSFLGTGGIRAQERRRIRIAMELVSEPRIVLLDEPFAGMDGAMSGRLMHTLRRMATERGSIIVLTARRLCQEMFEQIPEIMLLSREGRPLYFGKRQGLGMFLEGLGRPCPPDRQLSDFMMETACESRQVGRLSWISMSRSPSSTSRRPPPPPIPPMSAVIQPVSPAAMLGRALHSSLDRAPSHHITPILPSAKAAVNSSPPASFTTSSPPLPPTSSSARRGFGHVPRDRRSIGTYHGPSPMLSPQPQSATWTSSVPPSPSGNSGLPSSGGNSPIVYPAIDSGSVIGPTGIIEQDALDCIVVDDTTAPRRAPKYRVRASCNPSCLFETRTIGQTLKGPGFEHLLVYEISWLFWREVRRVWRRPGLLIAHLLVVTAMGLLVGTVFHQSSDEVAAFENRIMVFSFSILLISLISLTSIEGFVLERPLYTHEGSSMYFHTLSFFLPKVSSSTFFLQILPVVLYGT